MDFTAYVKELGLESLPEEEQRAIINNAIASVTQRVGLRLDELLSEEQKNHLDKTAEEKGGEAAAEELSRMYPEYPKLYQEELDKLKDFMKKVPGSPKSEI